MANFKLAEELDDQKSKLKDINDFLVNELKARALSYAVLQSDLAEAKKSKEDTETRCEVRKTKRTEEIIKSINQRTKAFVQTPGLSSPNTFLDEPQPLLRVFQTRSLSCCVCALCTLESCNASGG